MLNKFIRGQGHATPRHDGVRTLQPRREVDQVAMSGTKPTAEATRQTDDGDPSAAKSYVRYGALSFLNSVIASPEEMTEANVSFFRVINRELQIGVHMYSRFAVVRLNEAGQDCALFVDRKRTSPEDVGELVKLIEKSKLTVTQAYFATSTLIISIAQGHLNGEMLRSALKIARDPASNALWESFVDIVAWAYDHEADDLDFALNIQSEKSQVCFKIGGRYIRPPQYLVSTETMSHWLGIAWQRSGGGSSSQFDILIEQQAQITLSLPRDDKCRPDGAKVRLRWSGMAIDKGAVVTMRLLRLGQSAVVKNLDDAGYLGSHLAIFRRAIGSRGGLVCLSGEVGSGKTTTIASLLTMLPAHQKLVTVEDPAELEIPGAYQKTVARDLVQSGQDENLLAAARVLFRSALDVLYLGEVRDVDTGSIARQIMQSGHSVFTTLHSGSALGMIDRFESPQIGVPRKVLSARKMLKLLVFQALIPRNCMHCCMTVEEYATKMAFKGDALIEHHRYWERLVRLYKIETSNYRLRNEEGCEHCRREGLAELNGFNGRTVVCEMVELNPDMRRLIALGDEDMLYDYWRGLSNKDYTSEDMTGKTALECAVYKASLGLLDPRVIEEHFEAFETLEANGDYARPVDAGSVVKSIQSHRNVA